MTMLSVLPSGGLLSFKPVDWDAHAAKEPQARTVRIMFCFIEDDFIEYSECEETGSRAIEIHLQISYDSLTRVRCGICGMDSC